MKIAIRTRNVGRDACLCIKYLFSIASCSSTPCVIHFVLFFFHGFLFSPFRCVFHGFLVFTFLCVFRGFLFFTFHVFFTASCSFHSFVFFTAFRSSLSLVFFMASCSPNLFVFFTAFRSSLLLVFFTASLSLVFFTASYSSVHSLLFPSPFSLIPTSILCFPFSRKLILHYQIVFHSYMLFKACCFSLSHGLHKSCLWDTFVFTASCSSLPQ